MRRVLLSLCFVLIAGGVYSQEILEVLKTVPASKFYVRGVNSDVGTAYELIAPTNFRQMNGADSIQVVASAADTVRIRLIGILAYDSTRVSERIRVPGSAAAVMSTKRYLFFESARVDSFRATPSGTFTFRTDDDSTTIAVIAAGELTTNIAHRFFGRFVSGKGPEKGYLDKVVLNTQYDEKRIQRVPMIDGGGTYNTGVDTIIDTEADSSIDAWNAAGAAAVRLYTYGNQLTANDTVFVQAITYTPWDSLIANVALDSIIGDAGHESKDVTSLLATHGRFKLRLLGAGSAAADSTEVQLGLAGAYPIKGNQVRVQVRWYANWDSSRSTTPTTGFVTLGELSRDSLKSGTTSLWFRDAAVGYAGNEKSGVYVPNYGWMAAFGLSETNHDSLTVEFGGAIP